LVFLKECKNGLRQLIQDLFCFLPRFPSRLLRGPQNLAKQNNSVGKKISDSFEKNMIIGKKERKLIEDKGNN